MDQNNQTYFSDLRQRILNDALLWISITATPSVIISLSRIYILKLSPWIAVVQILLFSALWLTYFFRKKLAYHARVFSILIILWVGMTFGLLSLGPVANAGVYAILTAFIAILFLSGKGAAWVIAINTCSLILIGIAASKQWIMFNVDYPVYAHNPMVWVLLTWSLAAHAIIFALIGWRMIQGLLDSESKFHTLYDSTSDAVMLLDDKGVFDCNNAAMKMFGCTSKAQLMAVSIYELSPTSQPDGSNSIERTKHHIVLAKEKGYHHLEWTLRRLSDGTSFPAEVRLTAMTLKGKPILQATILDITERKHVDRMKNEFVSTVSHELRTPLTSISGALGLINGGALGEMPVQARQMLDIAYKNSQRLSLLINDLLDMDKLISGNMPFNLQPLSLKYQLEQALESNQAYGRQHQVSFKLDSQANELTVIADELRLQQVLSNFMSNAAKFSKPGGQVKVKMLQKDNMARVEVIDQGEGIKTEFYARIFEKFSQADSSDTKQRGGTGLGLAISKEIIERMDGNIGFDSVEGKGACFYFELPAQET